MHDFRRLNDKFLASPQINIEDLAEARSMGVTLVINNRPDGESHDQVPGDEIEAAAKKAGMAYLAIPVTQAGFSLPQVDALRAAVDTAEGRVLAYCRSGTRSTLLWALAEAKAGTAPDVIASAARGAGYDIGPVRQTIDMLASQPSGE